MPGIFAATICLLLSFFSYASAESHQAESHQSLDPGQYLFSFEHQTPSTLHLQNRNTRPRPQLVLTVADESTPEAAEWNRLNSEVLRLYREGKYADAAAVAERALKLAETAFGPDHPNTLTSVNNLGALYASQGRYELAEPLYKRALEARERVLGPDHPDTLTSVNNLGLLYESQGRYELAEPLLKRALEARERVLGPDHPSTLTSVNNLGLLYESQGRYELAEPLYKRALEALERVLGPDHPDTLRSVNNLGGLYRSQGRYELAEPLYKRALEASERVLGPDHPSTLTSVNNLGSLYASQGRYELAEPLYKRALEALERVLGPDHPDTLISVNNLGFLYASQGRYELAEPLFKRALEARERVLGPDHPSTLSSLVNYSFLRARAGDILDGLGDETAVRLLRSLAPEFDQRLSGLEVSEKALANPVSTESRAAQVLTAYERSRLANIPGSSDAGLRNAALQLSQRFASSAAAQALAASAARLSISDDSLQALEKQRADLARRKTSALGILDQLKQSPNRDEAQIAFAEEQLAAVQQDLDKVLSELSKDRDGAALTEVTGIGVSAAGASSRNSIRGLLEKDEALLFFTSARGQHDYLVFVVQRDSEIAISLDVSRADIAEQIEAVRAGLNLTPDGQAPSRNPTDLPSFNQQASHDLYEALIEPLLGELAGVKKLLIVADGPLQSLPFSVLVRDIGEGPADRFAAYGKARYLVDDYAVVVYPSVSSLETLRATTPSSKGSRPFLGFGDPVLSPDPDDPLAPPSPQVAEDPMAGQVVGLGGEGNWSKIEDLPDVAVMGTMLTNIGDSLGASLQEVLLRGFAREADLRYWNTQRGMDNYKVIAFGTHALVANELESLDLKEPAIVMSRPPLKAGQEYLSTNDGLFRASDVVDLDLDADMVILAACNTAKGDSLGAAPLSGLAKTFMYAGARSLLVSNWQADAASTSKLVPDLVARAQTQGYAKGLQQAKIALRNSADRTQRTGHYSHPAIWGTFTLIAEPRK